MLSAANGQVLDIRMPTNKELKATQELIYEKFENGEAKARGFVYVAWRKTPQRFLYVGKATNVDRLNLAAHGNLARATADATLLSLIFPSISREDYLLGVEASVIELVECLTGDLPELNTRTGAVPHSAATENLDALASFLGKVATDISRTGVWF